MVYDVGHFLGLRYLKSYAEMHNDIERQQHEMYKVNLAQRSAVSEVELDSNTKTLH